MSLFKARPWYFIWEKAGMNGEKESIIIKRVVKLDQSIGMATVYRLVKELENIGVLSREIVYK